MKERSNRNRQDTPIFRLSVIILFLLIPLDSEGSLLQSTRSEAMGGVRIEFTREASSAFLNPAAIGGAGPPAFYLDYSAAGVPELKGAVEFLPVPRFNLSLVSSLRDDGISVYGLSAAARLLSGTPGTYLNIGASAKGFTGIDEAAGPCSACGVRSAEDGNGGTVSAGIIFRPFPSFSLRYIGEWWLDSDYRELFEEDDYQVAGISFYLIPGLVIAFEREFRAGAAIDHFGMNIRTGLPVELMSGYYNGLASGGMRLSWKAMSFSVVFAQEDQEGVRTRVSIEYSGGPERDGWVK